MPLKETELLRGFRRVFLEGSGGVLWGSQGVLNLKGFSGVGPQFGSTDLYKFRGSQKGGFQKGGLADVPLC